MALILIAICAAGLLMSLWIVKRRRDRRVLDEHSIAPDALYTMLASHEDVLVFDVRLPLDLLADSEIIPGATRLDPKDVLKNPTLIPKEKDSVVYCTCPSDKSSRAVLHRALGMGFTRIKFLRGGLAAWKASGFSVEPYEKPFHLDNSSAIAS